MAANLAKAAAMGALAMNGGGANSEQAEGIVPDCPGPPHAPFHAQEICTQNLKPHRLPLGSVERKSIYESLRDSGYGATLIPNELTLHCPQIVKSLESEHAMRGFDTTWLVENKASNPVVISLIVKGVEWSPFKPNVKPMDDPLAILQPGEWISVPTFGSYVYHVTEIENGVLGKVLLQHRVGLVPIGNRNQVDCDASLPDVEPINPKTAERDLRYARTPHGTFRPCNVIDMSFRNEAGCPLHAYWANNLQDVPEQGFTCGEKFKFHLGTKPATQDFVEDWQSSTKFEGSFVGHTFVFRLASDPSIVIDSYTVKQTTVTGCANLKQEAEGVGKEAIAAAVQVAGDVQDFDEPLDASLPLESVAGLAPPDELSGEL